MCVEFPNKLGYPSQHRTNLSLSSLMNVVVHAHLAQRRRASLTHKWQNKRPRPRARALRVVRTVRTAFVPGAARRFTVARRASEPTGRLVTNCSVKITSSGCRAVFDARSVFRVKRCSSYVSRPWKDVISSRLRISRRGRLSYVRFCMTVSSIRFPDSSLSL